MIRFMDDDALDKVTPVNITIEDQPSKDGTKFYKTVAWVNKVGDAGASGFYGSATPEAKSAMAKKLVAMGVAKAKPKAPPAPSFDDSSEIPF